MKSIAIALFLSLAGLHAQTPVTEPESLTALRGALEKELATAAGPLNEAYEKRLAQLEASLASVGEYEQALAVKRRRDEIAPQLGASTAAPASAPGIPLPISTARLYGGVTARTGELTGWRTIGCAAEWNLAKVPPGNYQLALTYANADKPADPASSTLRRTTEAPAPILKYVFREHTSLTQAKPNAVSADLPHTAGAVQSLVVPGVIAVRSSITLRLAPTVAYPANALSIKEAKLVPALEAETTGPATAVTAPTLSVPAEAAQLATALPIVLTAARKPAIDAYLTALTALAVAKPQDDAISDALQADRRRASRLITDVRATAQMNPRTLNNYEELRGAAFVADPSNTGDTFLIEHEGRRERLRLGLLTCAPLDPSDTPTLKRILDHFGIEAEDAPTLATTAQAFTASYLEGQSLTILIKHSRKASDPAVGFVFLEDVGLFQSILIDHGLAALTVPPAFSQPDAPEAPLIVQMRQREQAAKTATPRPGGWAYSTRSP